MNGPIHRAPKAYQNPEFMNGIEGRPLRILAEYLEPSARFESLGVANSLVFYGSARIPSREAAEAALAAAKDSGEGVAEAERDVATSRYYEDARSLARRLAEWTFSIGDPPPYVICTGGGPGIMEAANRGAHEAGARSMGLGISLPSEEGANRYVSPELAFQFHYFFMRKFWLTYMAKAVVVMPGGFGTLDEMFEQMTLIQTGKLHKTLPIVLFGSSFWDEVVDLEALARHRTISPDDVGLVLRTDSVDEAYDYLTTELTAHLDEPPGPSL